MDFSIETLFNVLSLLLGGGGGAFFTWRYVRRKAKAEAVQAETAATKDMQDVYQQLISDVKADRDEQKVYIGELKEDRRHLRNENNELRTRIDETDKIVRSLQRDVARNGRMVESMRPFLCGDIVCKNRQRIILSNDGTLEDKS